MKDGRGFKYASKKPNIDVALTFYLYKVKSKYSLFQSLIQSRNYEYEKGFALNLIRFGYHLLMEWNCRAFGRLLVQYLETEILRHPQQIQYKDLK